ncbi:hypothetical protein WSM22_28650 [Cytophagales bacterium WSM2-2]|nr:hypothetical protein WSM22_28650 [Cytophagales bacterium WSM2-2]
MKIILVLLFVSTAFVGMGQQKKDSLASDPLVFMDTVDNIISAEEFREKIKSGKFDSISKFENGATVRTLVPMAPPRKTPFIPKSNPVIGSPFPEFNLKRVDGKEVSFSSLKGKLVVINFWYIGCKYCVEEIPILNKVVKHYQDNKDVIFLALSSDDRFHLNKFLTNHEFLYQTLVLSRELNEDTGILLFPTHLIVDKKGIIKEVIVGDQEIEKKLIGAIDNVMAGN